MRRPLILALALFPCTAWSAQIHRCESADGVPTYSDQPCAALGAVEVLPALPMELGSSGLQPAALVAPRPGSARGSGAPMCAAPSLQELPAAVGRAFASGDANALASLYHWPGLDSGDARRMYGRFQTLLAQPLRNVGFVQHGEAIPVAMTAAAGAAVPSPAPLGATELWLELGSAQHSTEVRFDVVENAGCVWLRFG